MTGGFGVAGMEAEGIDLKYKGVLGMRLDKMMIVAVVLGTANAFSMPTKVELAEARPLVIELLSPLKGAVNDAGAEDKSDAAVKIGDAAVEFAKSANTEAVRFLLLKGAVGYYARGESYDKAADALANLQGAVKDVPAEVIAEISGKAVGKVPEENAFRLYAIYRKASVQVSAEREVKTLAAKLKKIKTDSDQRRYAEMLAVLGNWKSAYAEFANVSNAKLKSVVRAEVAGKIKNAVAGEFWWSYEPVFKDADIIFKEHAAVYYRKALDGGEIDGLKKTIVEQRLASLAGGASKKKSKIEEVKEDLPVAETSESEQEDVPVKGAEGGRMPAGSVLSGLQVDESVVLDSVKTAYVVEGQYVVSAGKSLSIKEGVTVLFRQGAGILVDGGSFSAEGSVAHPVVFRGERKTPGFWKGILARSAVGMTVECAIVSGAECGLRIEGMDSAVVKSCVFTGNVIGAGGDCGRVAMSDCLLSKNVKDGYYGGAYVELDHCTVSDNGGWGVRGTFKFAAGMTASIVRNNREGGYFTGRMGSYSVTPLLISGCIFELNGPVDVKIDNVLSWPCTGNWWGVVTTRELSAKGAGAKCKRIVDARHNAKLGIVDVSDFLKKPPTDCGARTYPKVN